MNERFDDVIREYIDFVNQQVGVYMDALAGFAGHYTRVERQVHRVNRPVRSEIDSAGQQVVVWASYEDHAFIAKRYTLSGGLEKNIAGVAALVDAALR